MYVQKPNSSPATDLSPFYSSSPLLLFIFFLVTFFLKKYQIILINRSIKLFFFFFKYLLLPINILSLASLLFRSQPCKRIQRISSQLPPKSHESSFE